ncbi:helix-turn-helix domain-containing protein [Alginatibacterium sediminis]|uniref:Helix-turn-helix domain-containing protein n=1 Tax=Alginatibacterium sediminis TaxID=2164068 RepID=A0A420ECU8_9ALTE|nr:helix-turn-helix domain-containing protein [Alginatibacterium sediminis]RKF18559.1 helix-turn-helix domain-containing protein [Alginatibacterium sediminis]
MNKTYRLSSHQRHPQLQFCIQPAFHDRAFALHQHDFSELVIVLEGSARHQVGDFTDTIQAGDVFVINGHIAHGFSSAQNLKIFNLMFEGETPCFETTQLRLLAGYQALFTLEPIARKHSDALPRLNLSQDRLDEVHRLLLGIEHEYQHAEIGFETVVLSQLRQLVVILAREYQQHNHAQQGATISLARALSFIEQQLAQTQLRSTDIAKAAFLSTRQLERLFRRYLDTSPALYLIEQRVEKAKALLHDPSQPSMNQIAQRCGFSESNYFSRVFRQQTGTSPRDFRKRPSN